MRSAKGAPLLKTAARSEKKQTEIHLITEKINSRIQEIEPLQAHPKINKRSNSLTISRKSSQKLFMRDIEKNNNQKNENKAQSILDSHGFKFKPKINNLSRKIVRLSRSKSKSDHDDI